MCMCAYFAPHTFYASNMQVTLSFRTRRSSILPCQFSAIFLTGNADLRFSLSLGEEHHARIYSFLCKNKQTRQNKVRTLNKTWPACRRGVILSRFSDEQRRAWSARGVLSRASRAPRPLQACLQRSEQVGLKTKQAAFHTFYSKPMTAVYTI